MDILQQSLEPMLVITSKIKIQQEQENNGEADITVEPERQVSVLYITTFPVSILLPENIITPSKHATTKIISLDIQ